MTAPARRLVARGSRRARHMLRRAHVAIRPANQDHRVHYFGTTRFSLFQPDSAAWRLTRRSDWASPEDYAAYLFSEERMGPRCEIFCDVATPLYQQMAEGRRYRHLVIYSQQMPQRWKDRLVEAAERYPVLWLVESGDGHPDTKELLRGYLQQHSSTQDSLVFAFRVDDDDLLAADFLDQVQPLVGPHHHTYAVSFSSGYAGLYENGRYTRAVQWQQRLSSMGQGAIGTWRAQEKLLLLSLIGNHNRSDQNRTVLLDGRRPTFLQTRHIGQDTAVRENEPIDAERARQLMIKELDQQRRVTDPSLLLERFPTLAPRLDLDS